MLGEPPSFDRISENINKINFPIDILKYFRHEYSCSVIQASDPTRNLEAISSR